MASFQLFSPLASMGDPSCTTLLTESAARLAELRNDVHSVAELRVFPLLVETGLISTRPSAPFEHIFIRVR
jgi:hypothetical protein